MLYAVNLMIGFLIDVCVRVRVLSAGMLRSPTAWERGYVDDGTNITSAIEVLKSERGSQLLISETVHSLVSQARLRVCPARLCIRRIPARHFRAR